jgi:hypothetical protein
MGIGIVGYGLHGAAQGRRVAVAVALVYITEEVYLGPVVLAL